MKNWKQALWLTKYELKHSKLSILFILGLSAILLLLVVPIIPDYFLAESHSFNLDIFFLLIFIAISQWARPKVFQIQKVDGYLWASHFVITLNQLPITKDVIVKYRFLTYSIISLAISILLLTPLYILSPVLQDLMSIDTFIVFSIVWICFSIGIGSAQLVSEVGTNVFLNIVLAFFLLGPLFITLMIVLFYKLYPYGFVHWTMFVAIHYPLGTVIISLLLAIVGSNFWMRRMRRKMEKVDYLS